MLAPPVLYPSTPWIATLRQHRLIAVIRARSVAQGLHMAAAAAQGGARLLEVTWNSADPVTLLRTLQRSLPRCHIGAGTLLSVPELESAIAAGAAFCFSPHTSLALIERAIAAGIPMIPGAMTPTEIVTAWQAGAAAVKVFPIRSLGGTAYLRSLQGPLGQVPLVPTGGVDAALAVELVSAGAVAVGLSTALFAQQDVKAQNWEAIARRTESLLAQLATAPLES